MPNKLHLKNTTPTIRSVPISELDSGGDGGYQALGSVDGEVFVTLGNFSIRPVSPHAHDLAGGDYACLMLLGNGAGAAFNVQLRSDNGSHQQWTGVALRSAFSVGTLYSVGVHWDGSGNEQLSIVAEDGTVIVDLQEASGGGALPSLTGIVIDCAPTTAPLQNQDFSPAWIDGAAIGPSSLGILTGDDRYLMPSTGWHHVWPFDGIGSATTIPDLEGSEDITIGGATFPDDAEWVSGGHWGSGGGAAVVAAKTLATEHLSAPVAAVATLATEHLSKRHAFSWRLPTEHLSAQIAAIRTLSTEHRAAAAAIVATKTLSTEHLRPVSRSVVLPTEHLSATITAVRTLSTEHRAAVVPVVATKTLSTEHLHPVVATRTLSTEHRPSSSYVVAIKTLSTEHLAPGLVAIASVVTLSTEHGDIHGSFADPRAVLPEHQLLAGMGPLGSEARIWPS